MPKKNLNIVCHLLMCSEVTSFEMQLWLLSLTGHVVVLPAIVMVKKVLFPTHQ